MPDPTEDPDSQDMAEVFDEENITPDGRDIATSDMEPDLFDATASDEDTDVDEALAGDADDFDPDALDEASYEEIVQAEEDLDEPRSFRADDAGRISDENLRPADFEAGDDEQDTDDLRPGG